MAGRGPAPKDPEKRARANKDVTPATEIAHARSPQPELPEGMDWHERTRAWWAMWGEAPQSAAFMATDWDFLLDTAIMHTALWSKGQWTLAAEIRLRVAKLGATPEDRQRLRMHFAAPAEPEAEADAAPVVGAVKRYGRLTSLPTAASE
jgi:hypothetical protein